MFCQVSFLLRHIAMMEFLSSPDELMNDLMVRSLTSWSECSYVMLLLLQHWQWSNDDTVLEQLFWALSWNLFEYDNGIVEWEWRLTEGDDIDKFVVENHQNVVAHMFYYSPKTEFLTQKGWAQNFGSKIVTTPLMTWEERAHFGKF